MYAFKKILLTAIYAFLRQISPTSVGGTDFLNILRDQIDLDDSRKL